jgi:hypothetical protein
MVQYDRAHYLFTVGGTSCGGVEQWQTGLRYAPDAGTTPEELLQELGAISVQDCFDDWASVIANIDPGITFPVGLTLKWAKLAVIKTDGKYAGAPKIHEGLATGSVSPSSPVPPQLAWALTLGTGKSFGMAQKGRMYLPVPVAVSQTLVAATGQVAPGYSEQMRDKIHIALDAVEGEITTINVSVSAAVMSSSGGKANPTGVGTTNYVTELSVGRALDTQRSRRRDIVEAYTPAPALRGLRDTDLRPYVRR